MKHLLLLFVFVGFGCAGAADLLPRVGSGLMAVKDAYSALCEPPVKGHEAACEDARVELNKAIEATRN